MFDPFNDFEQSRDRKLWSETIHGLSGLDGQSIQNTVDGEYSDKLVDQKYQSFKLNRGI